MNTINRKKAQLSVAAVAALAIFAVATVMLLSGSFATSPAQAQENTNLNTGKYADPQPCGINANEVPEDPDGEFSGGHVALFDAYWDYNTKTLNNNLCPPLAEHTVTRDRGGNVTGIVTGRTKSNIDINETVFHAGNEFTYTITAADKAKYRFLPPVGTKVWWLKQDDPIAEAEAGDDDDDPELVLGISGGLFKKQDWYRDGGAPLQYEFESERDPEGNVIPFLVFKNGEEFPIWDSRKVDSAAIPIEPGEYDHYNWMFFPEAGQSHTYVLEVHLKGHVRTERLAGTTPDKWQPLTWPTGQGAPAYTPDKPTDAYEKALKDLQTVVTSEVRKEKYTIHVGPLHINEQPRVGVLAEVQAGAAAGAPVGEPIPMYGTDRDQLHYTLEGDGHENFKIIEKRGRFAGVNAQLVVAEGADLRYAGENQSNPDKAYYDLLLTVSDRHDREDGQDTVIDDTIPVRIFVFPSSGPWVSMSFGFEHPQVTHGQPIRAQVWGLPDGATITRIRAYDARLDQRYWLADQKGSDPIFDFEDFKNLVETRPIYTVAQYQLNGETKTVTSGIYTHTWRR